MKTSIQLKTILLLTESVMQYSMNSMNEAKMSQLYFSNKKIIIGL